MENTVTTSKVAAATEGPFRPVVLDADLGTLALLAQTKEGAPRGMKPGLVLSAVERSASFLVGSRFACSDSAAPLLTSHFDRVFLSRSLPLIEPVSDPRSAKLNRQTRRIERLVSYRKHTTATSSNRQKIKKCSVTFRSEVPQPRMLSFSLCTQQAILPKGDSL